MITIDAHCACLTEPFASDKFHGGGVLHISLILKPAECCLVPATFFNK